ncbi:MAG: HEAT repeat domain-containing protein [Methanobrevibacter sp.]|nr:HEAT repeat domain-containing protein [Methanobrevibacter sp.]
MKLAKKFLFVTALLALNAIIFAQSKESETNVENEYLTDVDGDIIMSLATSDELDNKLVALQYLQNAIEEGNTSDLVIKALDQLAGEGITSQTRTAGRISNNFPEVRRQACLLLAKVPTEHSKNTLVNIAIADNEPMVIAAAVQSLGTIGINDNDETVEAIAYANKRNQVLNPTSSLAMEVLCAYEKLADSTQNKKTLLNSISMISADYRYVTPVRQKAYKLLKQMSSQSSSSSNSNAK